MFPMHLSFHGSVHFRSSIDITIALTLLSEGGMFTPLVILNRLT